MTMPRRDHVLTIVAFAAIGLFAALWLVWLKPASADLQRRERALEIALAQRAAVPVRETPKSLMDELTQSTSGIAAGLGLTERSGRLHDLLARNKLQLVSITFRPLSPVADGLRRQELLIEARGSYYSLRFFLRSLLESDPLVSVQLVELRRPQGTSDESRQLRISLRLSLIQVDREAR